MSNNVVRFFAEKENAEAYSEWVKDPVTIHLLGMAADASRPLGMANPTSESALYLHGLAVGANSIVEFLRHADLFATPAGANVDPVATFGSTEILENWGMFPTKKSQEK